MAVEKQIELKNILGDNLITLAEFNMGDEKSTLAVCRTLDFDVLKKLKALKDIPYLFTKEELLRGIDVFPIEFLNIKLTHRLIHGEDFLKDMVISKKNLRQELEFEFRSKLIHLRLEYLHWKGKDIEYLIRSAVPTLIPILNGMLYLKDMHSSDVGSTFRLFSEAYGTDIHVLKEIHDIRQSNAKFRADKEEYIRELIKVLTTLGMIVDKIGVDE